jgi:hypothetical protein
MSFHERDGVNYRPVTPKPEIRPPAQKPIKPHLPAKKAALTYANMEDAHKKGYMIVFKLGTKDAPALPEEIVAFQELLQEATSKKLDIIWNRPLEVVLIDQTAHMKIEG